MANNNVSTNQTISNMQAQQQVTPGIGLVQYQVQQS